MTAVGDIPETLLTRTVVGVNLSPGRLADQLGSGMTLLVFLRHFGCMFCRETLADHPDYQQICEIASSEKSAGVA